MVNQRFEKAILDLLLRPFSFYVKCFNLPDLFAGKMHALLFREWKRVKGRDWFDLKRYIRRGTPLHLKHLRLRATDSGDGKEKTMTKANLLRLLDKKIDKVLIANIKADIVRFIPDPKLTDIWSPAYFHDLVKQVQAEKQGCKLTPTISTPFFSPGCYSSAI